MIKVEHYSSCNADYPEKVKSEKPRELFRMRLDKDEVVYVCVDCGASVIVEEK